MYNFFKMIKSKADLDPNNYSITELTRKLAESAGYFRGPYTFKNGNVRVRTQYTGKFDDILTAKWLYYFKDLFLAKLGTHPEMSEYHSQIIYRTFHIVMGSVDLDKLCADDIIHRYVGMSLGNRIGEVLFTIGSKSRLDEKLDKGSKRIRLNTAINHMALSLDQMLENNPHNEESYLEEGFNPIIVDLNSKLKNNEFGQAMLSAMLNSDKKIQLSHIDDFIYIPKDKRNQDTKEKLIEAYNIIKSTLRDYVEDYKVDKKRSWKSISNVSYSFEGATT